MNINQVRKTLDNRNVPYQDPLRDMHQIILRGTADIIEGDYNNDGTWTIFIRGTKEKKPQSMPLKPLKNSLNI
jgi:hypothetical protein